MSYFKYIEQRKKRVSDYINSVEDYTVLTETQQVVYDHFKSKYPNLDWILKKRVYSQVTDLLNEGTGKFSRYYGDIFGVHECGVNNFSPYYDDHIFIVGYEEPLFELYEKEFGFDNDTVELSYHEDSSMEITQLESDFYDELYNYSKDIVKTFWTIMEKEGSKYLSEILDELYKRKLLVLPTRYLREPSHYADTGWNDGDFTHPKLQKNWCYKFVGKVRITDVPMTVKWIERHDNNDLYLDKEKIDFKNITPVFEEGGSKSFFEKLRSKDNEEELKVA